MVIFKIKLLKIKMEDLNNIFEKVQSEFCFILQQNWFFFFILLIRFEIFNSPNATLFNYSSNQT